MEVVVNDLICKYKENLQVKFPKSKKKRIRNKWARNDKYYADVEKHQAIVINNILYVSSDSYRALEIKTITNGG